MAHTVNDVMNVIASPDYGIKNIAGTNQEILAILQGTHNSQNNIHNIVDDVRNLLQKLVDSSSEKKSIEIESTSTKVNHKHIESILDETRSIRKAIDNLAIKLGKEISGTPAVAKLSDKASEKVAEAMVKNIEKQKTGGGLTSVVDAFNKLKNISLKDILIGKRKVKLITKVFKNAQKELDIKEKDLDAVIKLINAAPQMIKSLSKVSWRIDRIIKKEVIKKLSEILVGKNSILTISKDIQKNEKTFIKANKISKEIVELSSSLNSVMWSLMFTSLWSKLASKGIKDIDSALNKIISFSKKLTKNKRDINKGTKAAKDIKDLASTLNKAMWKLVFAALWSKLVSVGIKSLDSALNKIITLSKKLTKNKNDIKKGAKTAKDIKDLTSSLNKAMRKLVFAALWAKLASFGIKSLDNTITKIFPLARKLTKNRDIIKKGAKAARRITALTGNLLIASIFLTIAAITAGPAILGAILLSKMIGRIIPVAKKLSRNSKHFRKAIIPSIMLLALSGVMALTSMVLATIAKTGLPALLGSILMLGIVTVNIISFKLLGESLKSIAKGAISMLIMSLSLMLFSVALSKITNATKGVSFKQVGVIALLTLVLAGAVALVGMLLSQVILGSIAMAVMSFALRPFATTLGMIVENTKNVTMKQVGAVAALTLLLAGTVALTGMLLVPIILGSIAMAVMSFALRPFATTLGMIVENTKNVTMKQVGAVAALIMALGGAVAGLAILLIPIGLGALAVGILSSTLKPFATTLGMISKATEKLTMKQVKLVSSAMWSLGKGVSKMALLLIPIRLARRAVRTLSSVLKPFVVTLAMISKATEKLTMKQVKLVSSAMWTLGKGVSRMARLLLSVRLGARTVRSLGYALLPFVRVLNILSKVGEVPIKAVNDVVKSLRIIGNFFKYNKLRSKVIKNANRYLAIMPPFTSCVYSISRLSKIGSEIPMKLVYGTLNAMRAIAFHYILYPIDISTIIQARRYKRMLRPFANTLNHLTKLKKMGTIPMNLVYATLNAMGAIAKYYIDNPIERKVIKQARRYKRMMRPFGYTTEHLIKLKKLGAVPMSLVYGTLNAMAAIANYYIDNPIEREVIKQARRYKRMLRPFGYAVEHLSKLKKMGSIPMKLVYQALNAIQAVADFYNGQKLGFFEAIEARFSANMITGIVSSFGKAVDALVKLKGLQQVPTSAINSTLTALSNISWFYRTVRYAEDVEEKSTYCEFIVDKFTTMAKKIQDKFTNLKEINHKAVTSIVKACRSIVNFYSYTLFIASMKKVRNMNRSIKAFTKNAKYIKDATSLGISKDDYKNIKLIVKTFKRIINFYTFTLVSLRKGKVQHMNETIQKFAETAKYIKDVTSLGITRSDYRAVKLMVKSMKKIINYYTYTLFTLRKRKVQNMNDAVKRFTKTVEHLKNATSKGFTNSDYTSVKLMVKSLKMIIKFFKRNSMNAIQRKRAQKNISLFGRMASVMSSISKISPSNITSIGSALTDALSGVNAISIDQVEAVTNMFNAFNGINKSKSAINKFAESVKEFTSACKDLMEAMGQNTEALNNKDADVENSQSTEGVQGTNGTEKGSNKGEKQNSGIRITNVEEIARTIAEKINGVLSVDMPDTQVQLLINGSGGNEWTITRY